MPATVKSPRRFPPPWSVEEHEEPFIVKERTGLALWAISTSMMSRSDDQQPAG